MDESGHKGLEEERRLAYVGVTRAEERTFISFAANRRVYNQWQSQLPSRFVDELPSAHVEVLTPPGLYGGGYGAAAPRADTPRGAFGGAIPGVFRASELEEKAASASTYDSPGWRRMRTRAGQRGTASPRTRTIEAKALPAFEIGQRVFHQKFGYGAVVAAEGDTLEIDFEKAGLKKVKAAFITTADEIPF